MSVAKTFAFGILAWLALATASLADPVSFGSAGFTWTSFEGLSTGSPDTISNASSAAPPAAVSAPAPPPPPAPAPAPTPAAAPTPAPASTPTMSPMTLSNAPAPAASGSSGMVDAYLNFGSGPYPEASYLTTGGAQSWYLSGAVDKLFGGTPNAQQQQAFVSTVAQRVEQTFQLSGVPLTLTTDPNTPAAHTMSIVSGTGSAITQGAIGETDIGRNGFNFIDQIAGAVQSVDQLEWVLAHNVSHELMLAFGVPEIHDQSGNYIDSTVAKMSMMLSPTATFSQGAAQDLLSKNFLNAVPLSSAQPQLVDAQPVPEPATLALWGLAAAGVWAAHRRRANRRSA